MRNNGFDVNESRPPLYFYTSVDLFEMSCFIYLDSKRQRLVRNGARSVPFLKTMLPIAKKHLLMRKDLTLTKSLFSEVSSSCSLRSPTDRCFRKTKEFSDFKFVDKISKS